MEEKEAEGKEKENGEGEERTVIRAQCSHLHDGMIDDYGEFQHLIALYLDGNELTELPLSITTHPTIQTLSVCSNKLVSLGHTLPPSLVYLDASHNLLSSLPDGIFLKSRKLKTIYLDQNKKLDRLPSSVCFLFKLRRLTLRGTCIRTLPRNIGWLRSIKEIRMGDVLHSVPLSLYMLPNRVCDGFFLPFLFQNHNSERIQWHRYLHHGFPQKTRKVVFTSLMCFKLVMHMPDEIIHMILSFLFHEIPVVSLTCKRRLVFDD